MSAMNCSEARETLWPIRQPKLVGGEVEAARKHIESCDACRNFVAQDQLLIAAYEQLSQARAFRVLLLLPRVLVPLGCAALRPTSPGGRVCCWGHLRTP